MTQRITIHYEAPTEPKYHTAVVFNKYTFVRNKEADGVAELWLWDNEAGLLCAAW